MSFAKDEGAAVLGYRKHGIQEILCPARMAHVCQALTSIGELVSDDVDNFHSAFSIQRLANLPRDVVDLALCTPTSDCAAWKQHRVLSYLDVLVHQVGSQPFRQRDLNEQTYNCAWLAGVRRQATSARPGTAECCQTERTGDYHLNTARHAEDIG